MLVQVNLIMACCCRVGCDLYVEKFADAESDDLRVHYLS